MNATHRKPTSQRHERRPFAHLYDTSAWRNGSKAWLAAHPLCVICEQLGYLQPAQLVDHITPHKGDRGLFFDQTNWQSLCRRCHDGPKKRQELTGRLPGTRPDGTPIDPSHPWNRESDPT